MAEEKKFLDQAGLKQAFEVIKKSVKAAYVAKEDGKGLSSNDFTDELKEKLENIDAYIDAEELQQAIADAKIEVEKEYVKETELADMITNETVTEEIVKIVESNVRIMTEAEIVAAFEAAPIVMHADGTHEVAADGKAAVMAARKGDTVVLVEDLVLDETVQVADGVVIDLNGNTLKA